MKFIKIFIFDLKNGFFKNKFLIITSILFGFFTVTEFIFRLSNVEEIFEFQASLGDYLLYAYASTSQSIAFDFKIPILWLMIMTLPAFSVLDYPFNDLQGIGTQFMYRTGKRNLWWLSKCLWNILTSLCFHLFLILIIISFTILTNVPQNLSLSKNVFTYVYQMLPQQFISQTITLQIKILVLAITMSISINLLQMFLSLFIKPLLSFLAISTLLIVSCNIKSEIFIANFSMLLRSDTIIVTGISCSVGFTIAISIILFVIFVGIKVFNKYDVLV